jgi:hypothetical protein
LKRSPKRENPSTRLRRLLAAYAKRAEENCLVDWTIVHLYVRTVTSGPLALTIHVAELKTRFWSATAVVNRASAETPSDVFEKHSHEVLGEKYRTALAAERAGNRFIRGWLKKHKPTKPCPCKPISPSRRSHGRGARGPRLAARRPRS